MGVTSYLSPMNTGFFLCGLGSEQLRKVKEIPPFRRSVSIQSQSIWDQWWKKCPWYWFPHEHFGIILLASFHQRSYSSSSQYYSYQKENQEPRGYFNKKAMFFRTPVAQGRKVFFTLSSFQTYLVCIWFVVDKVIKYICISCQFCSTSFPCSLHNKIYS